MAWKEVQINELDYTRKLLEESEASVEVLKEILKDKEVEITKTTSSGKGGLVQEYCDFDSFLKALGGSFADGFDDCFH